MLGIMEGLSLSGQMNSLRINKMELGPIGTNAFLVREEGGGEEGGGEEGGEEEVGEEEVGEEMDVDEEEVDTSEIVEIDEEPEDVD